MVPSRAVHLRFELPAPWTCESVRGLRVWTRPDVSARVEVDPLIELPPDRKLWGERVLGRGVPAGGSLRQTELVNSTSRSGWPITVVTTLALDPDGQPVELRVSTFYELLYYGTSVAAITPQAEVERWEHDLREPVLAAMLEAEPWFRGEAVANVAELWDLAATDRP
jgi:hypothetical protein